MTNSRNCNNRKSRNHNNSNPKKQQFISLNFFFFFLELQASNELIQGIIPKLFPIKIIIHSDNLIQKHSN